MANDFNLSVVGGKFRGSKLLSPRNDLTHPMGAREKNALFNRLGEKLKNAKVLDAYAGSGALGIEALSRGAYQVVLVEKNPGIAKITFENLSKFSSSNDASLHKVYTMPVDKFVEQNFDQRFDIIIADPPYDKIDYAEIRHLAKLLFDGGILVLSHPAKTAKSAETPEILKQNERESLPPEIPDLKLISSKAYAGAMISFYEK